MKRWIALFILTIGLLGGSWYVYLQQPEEDTVDVLIAPSDVAPIPIEPSVTQIHEVTLFVGDPTTGALVREIGEIQEYDDLTQAIAETVGLLIQPEPEVRNDVFPEGTELISVFRTNSGIVYLNLNRHLQDRHIGGIAAELATIASLVNTLLFNFQEVQQVQILVEGGEIETLAGHIDCRKPFSRMLAPQNS
jgi:spore germination protein GerM